MLGSCFEVYCRFKICPPCHHNNERSKQKRNSPRVRLEHSSSQIALGNPGQFIEYGARHHLLAPASFAACQRQDLCARRVLGAGFVETNRRLWHWDVPGFCVAAYVMLVQVENWIASSYRALVLWRELIASLKEMEVNSIALVPWHNYAGLLALGVIMPVRTGVNCWLGAGGEG